MKESREETRRNRVSKRRTAIGELLLLLLVLLLLLFFLLFANDHPKDRASCKWSSGGSGHLQIIIRRIRPLANNHPATCKWSCRGSSLLQMIIQRIQPLANDHLEDLASCKWSSWGSGHLQMIIWRIQPLANDHLEDLSSCKWSSGRTGILQMIIRHPRHPNYLSQDLNSVLRTFLEQFALVYVYCNLFQFRQNNCPAETWGLIFFSLSM